jgi:lipoprotein NlpI
MKQLLACICFGLFALAHSPAAEPVTWPEWRAPLISKLTDELKSLDTGLAAAPDSIPLLSRRGDHHLFLGHYPQAVADFERTIALDPTEDAPHWRLGIAYYFTGQFAKSAKQFEKYHAYDGHDRENGIWKFLAQEKADGVVKARAEMLTYTQFDREPFPSLYEMFAGKKSTDEVLAEITRKGLEKDTQVVFFGNYYAGLNEAMLGHRERALELLGKAVELPQARAEGSYMWQVARLHWERLRTENAPK